MSSPTSVSMTVTINEHTVGVVGSVPAVIDKVGDVPVTRNLQEKNWVAAVAPLFSWPPVGIVTVPSEAARAIPFVRTAETPLQLQVM